MAAANQTPSPQGQRIDPDKLTFIWGMEPVPMSDTPANFFVTGGVASGKTIILRLLMQSALTSIGLGLDHRAIVYDARGTTESLLPGMDLRCPMHILNPLDERGTAWDISTDIDSPSAAKRLAGWLIPEAKSAQPFFGEAARILLAHVCLSFINTAPGKWTLRDLLLAMQTRERLLSVLARAPGISAAVQPFFQDERHWPGVLSTITTALQPFNVVAAGWQRATQKLSLERWVREESVILLGDNPAIRSSVAPIYNAIFCRLADLILSQQESTSRRTWIFLDEFYSGGRLDSLSRLLQQGRSRGVCVAMSVAGWPMLQQLYGSETAEMITASCTHKAALQVDHPETAAWAARHFGPPLRASDFLFLPRPDPANGLSAFVKTPRTGTHLVHKSWDWVLANLRPPKDATSDQKPCPPSEHFIQDWTEEDYRRLDLGFPPSPK